MCGNTEQTIRSLFQKHSTRFNVVAELWSFENIKDFVQQDVGLAIVPRATVLKELREGTVVQIQVDELTIQRNTLMIFRDPAYLSNSARQFIDIGRGHNWNALPDTAPSPDPRSRSQSVQLLRCGRPSRSQHEAADLASPGRRAARR